ncbi:cell filamentation protein Fic, partial [bacterium]|nr:cell filamentation protein Fic [bacterium]
PSPPKFTFVNSEWRITRVLLNQAEAWRWIFHKILNGEFSLSKEFVFELHALAAQEEALEWGCFRKGQVTISGTQYLPPKASTLDSFWVEVIEQVNRTQNILERAIMLFLYMSRYQFFYDVNKRTARFMMNALLLSNGYPVINVPAKRSVEFNSKMIKFYESGHSEEMLNFMISCYDPIMLEIMAE